MEDQAQENAEEEKEDTPDYDSPWKKAIQEYFPEFISFYFPDIFEAIHWEKGYEFKNTELQKVFKESKVGRRFADCLIKVYRKDGEEAWILIHIEIQGRWTRVFLERMYIYRHRIWELSKVDVVSLAVLCDKSPKKPRQVPNCYKTGILGCELNFKFPMVRLMDLADDWKTLENDPNPFAIVSMAQIKAKEVKDGQERKWWKFYLTKMLYERGYKKEDILLLFEYIDWMIQLPKELEQEFLQEHEEMEKERAMKYRTMSERILQERGMMSMLFDLLETKFGPVDDEYREKIEKADDKTLQRWGRNTLKAPAIEAVFK